MMIAAQIASRKAGLDETDDHTRLVRFRPDKDPRDCTVEQVLPLDAGTRVSDLLG